MTVNSDGKIKKGAELVQRGIAYLCRAGQGQEMFRSRYKTLPASLENPGKRSDHDRQGGEEAKEHEMDDQMHKDKD